MSRRRALPDTFEDQIAGEKIRAEKEAEKLPHGPEKDALLRKIRQLDTASHMNEWLSSPGLQTPR